MASNERRESGRISVRVLSNREDRIEFEINNIDVAIANSLRRIMIAEVGAYLTTVLLNFALTSDIFYFIYFDLLTNA